MGLPSDYTRLEYIESTGTQYIDTGILGTSTMSVSAKFVINSLGTGTTFIFGAQGSDSTRYTLGMTSDGKFRSDFGSELKEGDSVILNNQYTSNKKQSICTINSQKITNTESTFIGTTNIYLFARSYSSLSYSKIKLYNCLIYNGDTLVRKFIPCKNGSNIIGLYDEVNNKFYTNAGTGSFTAGPSITNQQYIKINNIWTPVDTLTINLLN